MKKILFIAIVLMSRACTAQEKDILVPYKKASQWGFSDRTGKIVIAPVYDSVTLFKSVFNRKKEVSVHYSKVFQDNKVGLLLKDNTFLFPIQYRDFRFEYDSDRFTLTDANGKMGLRDFNTIYLPIEYESIKEVRNDSYVVQKNGKIGLADYNGKIVIPLLYDQLNYVSKDDKLCKWKVVNEQETSYVYTPVYNDEDDIKYDTVAYVEELQDRSTTEPDNVSAKYDWVERHKEFDYAYIFRDANKKGYQYGFENLKSKNSFKGMDFKLEFLDDYYDEKTSSQHFILKYKNADGKCGIIDETGTVLVPAIHKMMSKTATYCALFLDDFKGFYFPKSKRYFEAKYAGSFGSETFGDYSSPDFEIIGVYETSKKDWYYIGSNGAVFKE